jgi:hypothetical protein
MTVPISKSSYQFYLRRNFMTQKLCVFFAIFMGLVFLGCPNTTTLPPASIDIAAISGVTAPATGETPVTIIIETAQYTGTVSWSGSPATFAGTTVYTATITMTAKSGYTLTGVAVDFFTVAGSTSDTNSINSGVVTAAFPITGATPPTIIDIAVIAGVTAPVTGASPMTTISASAQFTGTVAWSGSPVTFAGDTTYSATITLTAKSGYTLSGVAADFFTVAGSTSDTNPINSGVITAAFPVTATAVIDIAAISGVTAPIKGASPVTTIAANAQYTGTVSWSGSPVTFTFATAYTATITLTPQSGYTLTGVAADFFTVAGSTSDSNSINSGVVTAIFPATGAMAIGDTYQGGIVAYFLQSGDPGYVAGQTHGIIAATADIPGKQIWKTVRTATAGTDGILIGTGAANTAAMTIDAAAIALHPAGAACAAYTSGIYTDWYMPSKNELNQLFLNRETMGGFTTDGYLCSTQYNAESMYLYYFGGTGESVYYKDMADFFVVRAVRSF